MDLYIKRMQRPGDARFVLIYPGGSGICAGLTNALASARDWSAGWHCIVAVQRCSDQTLIAVYDDGLCLETDRAIDHALAALPGLRAVAAAARGRE